MNNRHAAAQDAVKKRRTCNDLGICQATKPGCAGCTAGKPPAYPFAPGTIDAGPKRQGHSWGMSDFAGALLLVAVAYFLAGWLL